MKNKEKQQTQQQNTKKKQNKQTRMKEKMTKRRKKRISNFGFFNSQFFIHYLPFSVGRFDFFSLLV